MAMMETTEQIPVAHQRAGMPWDWESFPDFLDRLRDRPKGVNVLTYLPLNPLLIYVMGIEAAKTRAPNAHEMTEIHRLINEAMDAGAIGISMSVMGAAGNTHVDFDGTPMPTDVLDHEVVLEIGRALVERGEGVIQILSQIAILGDRSITERMADLAKGTAVRVIHNTFMSSDLLGHLIPEDLAWLDGQRAAGHDITVGCLVNRGWVEAGIRELDAASGQLESVRRIVACEDDEALGALLSDPSFVQAFAKEYAGTVASNGAAGLEGQTLIEVGQEPTLKPYLGRTLGEIAEETGQDVVETLIDLALRSDLTLQLKSAPITGTDPAQARALMAHSAVIPGGSDGGAHTKAFGMGHYPTDLLIWLVRETQTTPLEDMHFQLSLKPARSVRLADRGALLPGYWADVLIYDLDALFFDQSRYEIVHDMPGGDWRRKGNAGGYDYIVVNGEITHASDAPTGATPGVIVQTTTPS